MFLNNLKCKGCEHLNKYIKINCRKRIMPLLCHYSYHVLLPFVYIMQIPVIAFTPTVINLTCTISIIPGSRCQFNSNLSNLYYFYYTRIQTLIYRFITFNVYFNNSANCTDQLYHEWGAVHRTGIAHSPEIRSFRAFKSYPFNRQVAL